MEKKLKARFAAKVADFRLPRYDELPDVGLYLEQVTRYINGVLAPLGFPEITPSMVSNYVKKGVIESPEKKLYFAEHIGYLIFINVAKSSMSIEALLRLFKMQKSAYDSVTAYNYFCSEFENMLHFVAGLKTDPEEVGVTDTEEKYLFKSVIISAVHIIFISNSFKELNEEKQKEV